MIKWLVGVIGTILAGVLIKAFTPQKFSLSFISAFYVSIINYFSEPITLPFWVVFLLDAPFFGAAFFFIYSLLAAKELESFPEFRDYTEDVFFGLRWEWEWRLRSGKYDLFGIRPICQTCSRVMDKRTAQYTGMPYSDMSSDSKPKIFCEPCDFHKTFEVSLAEVIRRVEVTIDKKIRTGEFVEVIKRGKENAGP